MRERSMSPEQRHKGGKVLPALCNLLGILILLAIVVSGLVLVLPQWRGYDVYHVVSGSMAPEIPIGSIVYVHPIAPEDVQSGEIIAFWSADGTVITHRVVKNFIIEGEFSTKGDANPSEDEGRADYEALIGVVGRHYPFLGELLSFYSTIVGKIYIILFAACGAMLNILASRLRARHKAWGKPVKARHAEDHAEEPTS